MQTIAHLFLGRRSRAGSTAAEELMYLIPIHVPIHVEGRRHYIGTDWKRSLELMRDSLAGRFGPLVVLAPALPIGPTFAQTLESATIERDAIGLVPSFDARLGLKAYWASGAHREWCRQTAELLPHAQVVHTTIGDVFRPFCVTALQMSTRTNRPTVFVLDQDFVLQAQRGRQGMSARQQLESVVYAGLYDRQCRGAVRAADLVLLKGRTTVERYGPHARFVRQIEDTSYLSEEIVPEAVVEARVREMLESDRPLRFGFCGRLVDIKGVDDSIELVGRARKAGANVEFDVIGSGPELERLQRLAVERGVTDVIRFHGAMPYGAPLIAKLAACDALLFTPHIEETPRMIFDGYAAGLPLVARAIDYVVERAQADDAAVLLPRDRSKLDEAASVLVGLSRDRPRLAALTQRAMRAASEHAADRWYRRRAEWTFEMVERHRGAVSSITTGC